MSWLQAVVAGLCALVHVGFAFKEMLRWDVDFVRTAAPSWIGSGNDRDQDRVRWAEPLVFNVGTYNLMLAAGLAWTSCASITRPEMGTMLGIFFAIWLLVASAAAFYTRVVAAGFVQGALGLLLLAVVVARTFLAA